MIQREATQARPSAGQGRTSVEAQRESGPLSRIGGKILWVSITPVYVPAPGGGAVQALTIARGAIQAGDDMVILTEAYPGEPVTETVADDPSTGGRAWVERRFPFRAGRARKDMRSYIDYFHANLRYLALPKQIDRIAAQQDYAAVAILVHTSLLYSANTLEWILPRFAKTIRRPVVLIAELQDHFLPDSKLRLLPKFDFVVTTAEGVAGAIKRRAPDISERVRLIPMPFDAPETPTEARVAATLEKFGLRGVKFLLNANGLTEWKHTAEMREALAILRRNPALQDMVLVTVGRERDRTPADNEAEAAGLARYLGPVLREDVLALMRAAELTLVLSPREAISRVAVEAMYIGAGVLLPDLAEYREECASHVCSDLTPQSIAHSIEALLGRPPPPFPFDRHSPDVFVPLYRALVAEALESRD